MSKINRLLQIVRRIRSVIIVTILFGVSGCSLTDGFVAVEEKFAKANVIADIYTVKKGDTLYSIAWELGINNSDLASINNIAAPYLIFPGQKLRTRGSISRPKIASIQTVKKSSDSINSENSGPKLPSTKSHIAPKQKVNSRHLSWSWPASGRIVDQFSTKKPVNKGIDIAGRLGDSVYAAAEGSVVYAGTGLRGYGKLVIIRHNEQFLSAYAHTNRILVNEGDQVKVRQKIAEIGSTGAIDTRLHFEIRKDGQPINPLQFLPSR